MKKLTSLFLSLTLLLSLAACGSADTPGNSPSPTPSADQTVSPDPTPTLEPDPTPALESDSAPGGRVLVAYFSASGSTERVAGYIADTLGADTFELVPVNPYSSDDLDWTTDGSRVNLEHDDETLRNVELEADTVENWADYDTIFVGYPIWWGIAAWPVNGFVQSNDFTGKTVIPFCTSASSGLGESGELLTEMAGTGNWLEGMRFRSSASQEDVAEWIEGLNLNQ